MNLKEEIAALQEEVAREQDVVTSAVTLINGIQGRIDAAVAEATAAGATQEQLAAIQAVSDSLKTNDDALAAAVLANTPAAP